MKLGELAEELDFSQFVGRRFFICRGPRHPMHAEIKSIKVVGSVLNIRCGRFQVPSTKFGEWEASAKYPEQDHSIPLQMDVIRMKNGSLLASAQGAEGYYYLERFQ
ncbi:MAG: hypothetical protein PHW75_03535 [Patescibacteria group bacterium]|nr:hypothetical protein [Patescibacteria group bacterium]